MLEARQLLSATPIISELLAGNKTGLVDSFGQHDDWLEIYNPDSQQCADLTGWSLQYKNTNWPFPAMTLGPGEYRVIFCSSRNLTDPNGELHTSFNLSKSGANLSLLDPNNNVVQSFSPYPQMQSDISYGVGQSVTETMLVSAGDRAHYLVPTSNIGSSWIQPGFDDSSWLQGGTGLGFANTVPGLAVSNIKANISIPDLTTAQAIINTPADQSWVQTETAPYVNYQNTGGGGHFTTPIDRPYPGLTIGTEADWFLIHVTATVHIATAGAWTFGVNSDDGFQLKITGATFNTVYNSSTLSGTDTISYAGLRGASDTLGVINSLPVGDYSIDLIEFQNGGGASAEFFAAPGAKGAFDSTFKLVGDTANGGLSAICLPVGGSGTASSSTFLNQIHTNVKSAMQAANNATLYARMDFDAPSLASLQTLTLKMAYDDGFVAYLNGQEIARRNAPTTPVWNSTATAQRTSDMQSATFETFDVTPYLGLLTPTGNVLAIRIMNSSATDGNLLVVPELEQFASTQMGLHFFSTPSPGAPNTADTWQPDLGFSVTHGFFTTPFQLSLSKTTTGTNIYYTLDSSTPSATHGTLYTAPITIATTTTVRAVSVVPGGDAGVVATETYVFPNDVVNQPASPAGYPTTWNTVSGDYSLDPRITSDPAYKNLMVQALESIPTMSLVTDEAYLFDPTIGVYVNSNNGNLDCPVSLEYFSADGTQSFQINANLTSQGGVGREDQFKKHSFRVIFKAPFGPTKLDYPLFGNGAINTFDSITLRAGFNDSYVWGGASTQYIRNQFVDQTLLAMGDPAGHGNYVNLYINGMYWGLYNPIERPDANFAAKYLGGDATNWDANQVGTAINGTDITEYTALTAFNYQNGSTAAYQQLQGNNPDGTPNPAYPDLLNISDYIDYMLMNFYVGNLDWPGHNWYMAREEDPGSTGFFSFPWDGEMSLGGGWASDPASNALNNLSQGQIAAPFNGLRANADFVQLFADHVQKFLYNGGPLTDTAGIARYQALADEVALAIIGESARWGDETGTLYTPADWTNERNYVVNTWLAQRTETVIAQLRAAGLFPSIDAPSFSVNGVAEYGGTFNPGDTATIGAGAGTIYYTLDGSDPRLQGGAINPHALTGAGPINLGAGMEIKARLYNGGTWSALADASFYVDLAPKIRITEIMYNPPAPTPAEAAAGFTDNNAFEFVEIKNISTQTLPLLGLRFTDAVTFTFPNITISPGQYLLVVANTAAFEMRYPGVSPSLIAGQYTGQFNNAGEHVELDAPNGGIIHSFTYDNNWYSQTDGGGFSLTVRDPLQALSLWDGSSGWRASAGPLGSPGTDDTLTLPGTIVFNEVLAHTSGPQGGMIELYNTTSQALNIGSWFVSDSIANLMKYQFANNTTIAGNGYLVLTQTNQFGNLADPGCHTIFALSGNGGDLYLSSNYSGIAGGYREHVTIDPTPDGVSIGRVTKSTGGTDFTLLQTPTFGAAPGYPGAPNSIAYISPLVINEIMYHPADPTAAEIAGGFTNDDQFEYLELYNRSESTLNLANYYVGDGVGFTFGWSADGVSTVGTEKRTLESGATANWSSSLAAGSYQVWVHLNLVDGVGNRRTNLDDAAQYTINNVAVVGSVTVSVDQNQTQAATNDIWVSLGTYSFSGAPSVTLMRGDTGPGNWTIADAVKFSKAGVDTIVSADLQLLLDAARPGDAGAGRLCRNRQRSGGIRCPVSHRRQWHHRGRRLHRPPRQQRRVGATGADSRPTRGLYPHVRDRPGQLRRQHSLAQRAGWEWAGAHSSPSSAIRQRTPQLAGQQALWHAGPGQRPGGQDPADGARRPQRRGSRQPHQDHAELERVAGQREWRGSLRHLPRRHRHRHDDRDNLRRHRRGCAYALFLPGQRRQPRRLREQPVRRR